jgi:hypothetical protein
MQRLFLFVAAALGLTTTAASAGTLNYTSYGVTNAQNVHITDPALGVNNEYGGAGQIVLYNGSTPVFEAWCVDIQDWLSVSGTYTTGSSPSSAGLSPPADREIGALIYAYNTNASVNSVYNASAAIQLAIWQIDYGSGLLLNPDNSALTALADQYVADVSPGGSWTLPSNWDLDILYANIPGHQGNQNLAYVTDVPVAEPGTLMLWLTGLAALRRRPVA